VTGAAIVAAEILFADWTGAELAAAVRATRSPGNVFRDQLAATLRRDFPAADCLLLNSGRTALRLALQLLKDRFPHRHSVILPAYICPSVVEAVGAVGLTPVPVPTGPNLLMDPDRLGSHLTADVLAVVVAHMYGAPAPVAEICAVAAKNGIDVIDDAAHCYPEGNDTPPGSRGAFGVLSFAVSKAVTSGYSGAGGILIINDPSYASPARAIVATWPLRRGAAMAVSRFGIFCLCAHLVRRLPYRLTSRIDRAMSSRSTPPTEDARISELDAAIATVQIRRRAEIASLRASHARTWANAIQDGSRVWLPQRAALPHLTRLLVAFATGTQVDIVRRRLTALGIHTRQSYPPWVPGMALTDPSFELPLGGDLDPERARRAAATLLGT